MQVHLVYSKPRTFSVTTKIIHKTSDVQSKKIGWQLNSSRKQTPLAKSSNQMTKKSYVTELYEYEKHERKKIGLEVYPTYFLR